MLRFDVDSWKISTHTLARRVTAEEFQAYVWDEISTHTLARRVTPTSIIIRHVAYISTHTLARRVTGKRVRRGMTTTISTHTLARRVTAFGASRPTRPCDFNPHPRTEGDRPYGVANIQGRTFQPTPSHGG